MQNLSPEFLLSVGTALVTVTASFFAVRGLVSDLKTRVDYIEKNYAERLAGLDGKQKEIEKKLDTMQETLYEIRGYLTNLIPPPFRHNARHGEG